MVVVEICQHLAYSGNLVVSIQLHGAVVMQIPLKCAAKKKRHDDRCECSHNIERDSMFPQPLHYVEAMLSQLSYQSHMRVIMCGLALYIQCMFSGRNPWLKFRNSTVIDLLLKTKKMVKRSRE